MSHAQEQHELRLWLLDATGRRREAVVLRETLPTLAEALDAEAEALEAKAAAALRALETQGAVLETATTYHLAVRAGAPGALAYVARELTERALAGTTSPEAASAFRTAYSALDQAHRSAEAGQ